MVEALKPWGGVTGLNVDADNFPHVVPPSSSRAHCGCAPPQAFWTSRRRLGGVAFSGNDAGRVVFPNGSVGEGVVTGGFTDLLESLVVLACAVHATISEHGVVNCQLLVLLPCKKPDRFGLIPCGFPDGLPDVPFVKADHSDLREVKVFEPSVAIVDDELYRFPPWWYGVCSCCRYLCQRCPAG